MPSRQRHDPGGRDSITAGEAQQTLPEQAAGGETSGLLLRIDSSREEVIKHE